MGGDLWVNEKVLAHGFGKMEAVALQQRPDGEFVAEIHGSTAFIGDSGYSPGRKQGVVLSIPGFRQDCKPSRNRGQKSG